MAHEYTIGDIVFFGKGGEPIGRDGVVLHECGALPDGPLFAFPVRHAHGVGPGRHGSGLVTGRIFNDAQCRMTMEEKGEDVLRETERLDVGSVFCRHLLLDEDDGTMPQKNRIERFQMTDELAVERPRFPRTPPRRPREIHQTHMPHYRALRAIL